jgi:hypothetical protein
MNFLLCSAVSKYLGHFPEGLVEFHILIDALDCPALGHPATVRATAGTVALIFVFRLSRSYLLFLIRSKNCRIARLPNDQLGR